MPIGSHWLSFLQQGYWQAGWKKLLIATVFTYSFVAPAAAQTITTDGTLSTTVSSTDNQNFTITGGNRAGNNLFHSFDTFSIPTGGSAVFANPTDILNIISRVSGKSTSNIDGLIQANGTANLFLFNPTGIVFGPDAQLNIGGSFLGSTAEILRFEGGVEFSTTVSNPLLSISAPTGLQLGSASKGIDVNDSGYRILAGFPLRLDSSSSLQIKPGNTLALVGSEITLQSGALAAPGGRVELGSVQSGTVSLATDSTTNQWSLGYDNVQTFGNLTLSDQSLLNTSDLLFGPTGPMTFGPIAFGSQGGSIQLQGHRVSLQGGSTALVQNFGSSRTFGNILIRASEAIDLEGTISETIQIAGQDTNQEVGSGFATTSIGPGEGGDIALVAPQLRLVGGGSILTETFGPATSDDISLAVSDAIRFDLERADQTDSGTVFSISYGSGAAGDIDVSTGQLVIVDDGISSQNLGLGPGGTVDVRADAVTLTNGGNLASATLGPGAGGNVFVEANDINVIGVDPSTFFPTTITVATTNSGHAGNLTILTQQLNLQAGGRIDASTFASGSAGTVDITATDSVIVNGTVPGSINPSLIISSANEIDPALRAFFESQQIFVPTVPEGDSGDVTITTPRLSVSDNAQVTVRNDGFGDAGLVTVNADSVILTDNAALSASTRQGSGGNIQLNLRESLLLRQGSKLSAEAGGIGNGGNITLNASALVALDNSDIIANAFQGSGGNIQINAQSILGTQFREQLTPESDITASSEFRLSGVVAVTSPDIAPGAGIVRLPENVADASGQIVAGCASGQGSQFIATGHGGLAPNPTRQTAAYRLWNDVRSPFEPAPTSASLSAPKPASTATFTEPQLTEPQLTETQLTGIQFTEASTWSHNSQGNITLIALTEHQSRGADTPPTCLSNSMAQAL
ncbi:MAG: S-layer family protein [Cyanobacteria bacterium P01_F01_bin.53]